MKPLKIRKYPHKVLRKVCEPVKNITKREVKLFENMLFTMRHSSGMGLAAPQIGITKRLIVADIGEGAVRLANPEIVKIKGTDKMVEGCLSIPDVTVDIERPYEVVVTGLNKRGKTVELEVKGLLARVLQHEIDHLNGKLIIDYASLLEKFKLKMHKGRRYEGVQY